MKNNGTMGERCWFSFSRTAVTMFTVFFLSLNNIYSPLGVWSCVLNPQELGATVGIGSTKEATATLPVEMPLPETPALS